MRCLVHLEVIEGLDVIASGVQLLVVDALNLSQRLSHLILPELAVLVGRVTIGQCRQLLQLLYTTSITRQLADKPRDSVVVLDHY